MTEATAVGTSEAEATDEVVTDLQQAQRNSADFTIKIIDLVNEGLSTNTVTQADVTATLALVQHLVLNKHVEMNMEAT